MSQERFNKLKQLINEFRSTQNSQTGKKLDRYIEFLLLQDDTDLNELVAVLENAFVELGKKAKFSRAA